MVLSTARTIRELCSSTTPTSQFTSLHFIASAAIGAKSIERRARRGRSLGRAGTLESRHVLAPTAAQPADFIPAVTPVTV
ncbi:unnamed protein product [Leptosia nina]|uniref:Uncharacterized protein n=1 Tax=Leptosia nina TaxID=320188 RepID=A0AAV1JAJ8_9NEOP